MSLTVDGRAGAVGPDLFTDYVVVVTFVALSEGSTAIGEALIDRLVELEQRLRPHLRDRLRVVIVPLERDLAGWVASKAALASRRLEQPERWLVIDDERPRKLTFAALFGVVTWRADGALGHTISVGVVRDGRISDLFAGLDNWDVADLLGSVATALR